MYATNHYETALLNAMRGQTLAAPAAMYAALFLTSPTDTGTAGTEVSYPGYARKQLTFSPPAPESGGTGIKNTEQADFAKSDQDAGTALYLGLFDSPTGGNLWAYGALAEPLEIKADTAPVLLPGEVIYYFTGDFSNYFKTAALNVLRGQNIEGFSPCFALFHGDPENGGAELSGDNYRRMPLVLTAPTESDSGQSVCSNAEKITFPRPTTSWGTWDYDAIYDAETGGHPIWIMQSPSPRELKRGSMPVIEGGAFRLAVN